MLDWKRKMGVPGRNTSTIKGVIADTVLHHVFNELPPLWLVMYFEFITAPESTRLISLKYCIELKWTIIVYTSYGNKKICRLPEKGYVLLSNLGYTPIFQSFCRCGDFESTLQFLFGTKDPRDLLTYSPFHSARGLVSSREAWYRGWCFQTSWKTKTKRNTKKN